jgi:hypothetical protein
MIAARPKASARMVRLSLIADNRDWEFQKYGR